MNGSPTTSGVPAVRHRRQRRKRGIVPKGGRAALSPKERRLHAELRADGRLKSGRCGGYDYYVVKGKQRWRRHSVPKDPRTPAQQRSRARFAAASKTWSEDGPLTEAEREAWYADGAKKRSRPRLGSSGPLTGQQNYIGRTCTRKQRDSEMLLRPRQREQHNVKNKGLRPELTDASLAIPANYAINVRDSPGTRRACAVYSPGSQRVCKEIQGPRVNVASASPPKTYAINVRPPPEQHRSPTGATPVEGGD